MSELGKEIGEVSSSNEIGSSGDMEEINLSDISDDELSCDIEQADVSESNYHKNIIESDLEDETWNECDLEADYRSADEVNFKQNERQDLDAEEGSDLNEYVPSEWESIEGEHNLETDAERVNPNYNPEKNGEWENNCQSCAPAYEMRRRGYDVEAKPFTQENEYLSYRPEDAWDNPDIQMTEGNGKADIERKMQEWGDGSRAEVIVYWKEGGGHAFSAEQVDGQTKFVDPQVASSSEVAHDADSYFEHVKDDGSTYYWRTDDAKPHPNIKDCCKEVER